MTINEYVLNYSQLPDKSIPTLVKYYYSWKKTRSRSSVMDAAGEAKPFPASAILKNSEPGSDSDNDEKVCIKFLFTYFFC